MNRLYSTASLFGISADDVDRWLASSRGDEDVAALLDGAESGVERLRGSKVVTVDECDWEVDE